ncbi:MAG: AMP-dependent synthetase, partial [Aeromicrobium sp.]|nr:AMP-dependent synthetase [Aeromicrobium sp.]
AVTVALRGLDGVRDAVALGVPDDEWGARVVAYVVPSDAVCLDALADVPVVRTYGMSETCGGCVYDGVPLDGVQVRIDEAGQVQIAGSVLFDGYVDAEATALVLRDGWFSTADLGEIADGVLHVTGRVDDVVISGGVNIALPAVTVALRGLDGVRDAVALGVPDDEWGARVVAYVVPSDAVCLDGLRLDEVRDGIEAAGLPRAWAPREIVLLDALPLLPGGKVDRRALQGSRRPTDD